MESNEDDLARIRQALLAPSQLPHMVWRQELWITAQGKRHHLEAVLQNDGQTFQVLALGPGGMKLFLVTQDDSGVSSEIYVPRPLNLSPEYLLFDIQRAIFWADEPICAKPTHRFSIGGFWVTDFCQDGRVMHRTVSDQPDGASGAQSPSGAGATFLKVDYPGGFDFRSAPNRLTLRHEQRGYQIEITQLETHELP